MKLQCPVEGCKHIAESPHGIAGHISGHIKRGEVPKGVKLKGVKIEETQKPEPSLSSAEIADTLLKRVVKAINDQDFVLQQLKEAKARAFRLEEELSKVTQEKDRILKIHNDLVKRGNGDEVSSAELLRLATAPVSKI